VVCSCFVCVGRKKVDGGLVHGLSCSLTVSPPTMSCDYCDCRLNESFLQLDGAKVRDQVERTWANSYKASKKFLKEYPEMSKVALTLREETTEFKTLVPIIEALGNKAMKDRHWQVLAEETGTCGGYMWMIHVDDTCFGCTVY
jgi:hypothetical protein